MRQGFTIRKPLASEVAITNASIQNLRSQLFLRQWTHWTIIHFCHSIYYTKFFRRFLYLNTSKKKKNKKKKPQNFPKMNFDAERQSRNEMFLSFYIFQTLNKLIRFWTLWPWDILYEISYFGKTTSESATFTGYASYNEQFLYFRRWRKPDQKGR